MMAAIPNAMAIHSHNPAIGVRTITARIHRFVFLRHVPSHYPKSASIELASSLISLPEPKLGIQFSTVESSTQRSWHRHPAMATVHPSDTRRPSSRRIRRKVATRSLGNLRVAATASGTSLNLESLPWIAANRTRSALRSPLPFKFSKLLNKFISMCFARS
jgi:hypothetical protein